MSETACKGLGFKEGAGPVFWGLTKGGTHRGSQGPACSAREGMIPQMPGLHRLWSVVEDKAGGTTQIFPASRDTSPLTAFQGLEEELWIETTRIGKEVSP